MTQKKSTPKKAPKRVQRVERAEEESDGRKRVERVASKKRNRSPSSSEEEEKEIKKRRKTTKISCPILHEKLRCRNERRRLKGRFSFGSVDFFTNILLIEIMIANPNPLKALRKEKTGSGRCSRR